MPQLIVTLVDGEVSQVIAFWELPNADILDAAPDSLACLDKAIEWMIDYKPNEPAT